MVHQRAKRRGLAAEGSARRRQRRPAPDDRPLRAVRTSLHRGLGHRFRRAAAAQPRALTRQPGAATPIPTAVPARARRRVPGHQRDSVPLAALAGGARRHAVRRRRRRSIDLPLARRASREPLPLPAGLRGNASRSPRAELPLDRHDLERRERRHCQQRLAARQDAVDGRSRGRADQALRRVQRARRGGVRHQSDPGPHRSRRQAQRSRRALSLERPVASVRRDVARGGDSRTASTADCGSSSARRSRMRSRICASS